jgi:glycosyltransferase EpsD
MSKRILFCATVDYHFNAFHLPYMKWFKEQGWEVHVAASGEMVLPFVDKKYNIPIQRSPLKIKNILAYKKLKNIILNNDYKIIHCHTPMGGVLARLAARTTRKRNTKVIYTAHGFHFCKGAPLINWLLYYPIEKILSSLTDCLITINQEDYQIAKRKGFKAKEIKHVHGVGVNTDLYKPVDQLQIGKMRENFGYKSDDFLLFYAAEFNKNKNHQLLIDVIATIKKGIPNAKLLLAGDGPLLEECQQSAVRLGVQGMIHFLGYRTDIQELLKICNIAVASSLREGLPVNIMEAMASGLPIVATTNRGHRELVNNGVNGFIISPNDKHNFASKILDLFASQELSQQMSSENLKMIKGYSLEQVTLELSGIYSSYMVEGVHESQSKYYSARL